MRKALVATLALLCALGASTPLTQAGDKKVHVKGYTKKDGTYVKSHERSAPHSKGSTTTTSADESSDITPAVIVAQLL